MTKRCYLHLLYLLIFAISVNAELTIDTSKTLNRSVNRPEMIVTPLTGQNLGAGTTLWKAFLGDNEIPAGVSNISAQFPQYYFDNQVATIKNMQTIAGKTMKDGIVMCTGLAVDCKGPNDHGSKTGGTGTGVSDPDVLNATAGISIYDTPILVVNFTTDNTVEGFTFRFAFGTEEYPEYVGSKFNDIFICLLNGRNICFDSQGKMISLNSALFDVDNQDGSVNLQWDGFTFVLKVSERLSAGNHTLKFAVADVSDGLVDAGVFLSDFKFEYDTGSMVPDIEIVEPETLLVAPTNIGNIPVGKITNLCPFTPTSCKKISGSNQFSVNQFDVSTAATCDLKVGDEFTITVEGLLDTTWEGKSWVVRDTADILIKVEGNAPWPEIDSATILDSDGDGVGDSMEVFFEYQLPTEYTLKRSSFEWGGESFTPTLTNSDLNAGKDRIQYSFSNSYDYHTFGSETVSITIDSLDENSIHSGDLNDGIGPILIDEAILEERLENGPDTLTVSVSEEVNVTSLNDKEFILRKGGPSGTKVTLTLVEAATNPDGNSTDIKFICEDEGSSAPEEGDYLQINPSGAMKDSRDNRAHDENKPVPIKLNRKELAHLEESIIFDRDADGKADSIEITFNKAINMDMLDEIRIEFPAGSGDEVVVNKSDLTELSSTKLMAKSFEMSNINTSGSGDIEVIYDSLGSTVNRDGAITENIAPVIVKAVLIDSVKSGAEDRLTVEFSESVEEISSDKPFKLFSKAENKKFDATVSKVSQSGSEAIFTVDGLSGVDTIQEGDSIQCHWSISSPIEDTKGHTQENEENILCEIEIITIEEGIKIVDAAYEDRDANGRIETILLTVYGEYESYLDEIIAELTLPGFRNFTVDSYSASGQVLTILVTQDITEDQINTATTSDDIVAISDSTTLPDDMLLLPASVVVKDRMAPVIMSASLLDSVESSATDLLSVEFSEVVEQVNGSSPFRFYDGTNEYDIQLSSPIANGLGYTLSVDTKGEIANGDSINIEWNPNDCVIDTETNGQGVELNIRRPISVKLAKNEIRLTKVIYYDDDADGLIGPMELIFEGEQVESSIDEIVKAITLPGFRSFPAITNYSFANNKLHVTIEQNISEDQIETAVRSDERVEIETDVELNEKSRLLAASIHPVDSVAPIIMSASLLDSIESSSEDILTVNFSENPGEVNGTSPFRFYKGTTEYDIQLSNPTADGATFTFSVETKGEIEDGDSIHIEWQPSSCVVDVAGNGQGNEDNIKRPISVKIAKNEIRLTEVTYFDEDADGLMGPVEFTFAGEQVEGSIDEIAKALSLPGFRSFPAIGSNYSFSNNKLLVHIEQDINIDEIETAVRDDERVEIEEDVELNEKSRLLAVSLQPIDSVAPVIVKASMIDFVTNDNTLTNGREKDTLFLTFSENIQGTESIDPFLFYSVSEDETCDIDAELFSLNDEKAIYLLGDIHQGVKELLNGDSVWINSESSSIVTDSLGVVQENIDNRKVPISITRVESPMRIKWEACATILDLDGSDSYENEEIMRITVQPTEETKELLTSQDRLVASVTVLDKVGNVIFKNREMEFLEDNGILLLKWDGTNVLSRSVGAGGYLALIEGKRYFDYTSLDVEKEVEHLGPFTISIGVEE